MWRWDEEKADVRAFRATMLNITPDRYLKMLLSPESVMDSGRDGIQRYIRCMTLGLVKQQQTHTHALLFTHTAVINYSWIEKGTV